MDALDAAGADHLRRRDAQVGAEGQLQRALGDADMRGDLAHRQMLIGQVIHHELVGAAITQRQPQLGGIAGIRAGLGLLQETRRATGGRVGAQRLHRVLRVQAVQPQRVEVAALLLVQLGLAVLQLQRVTAAVHLLLVEGQRRQQLRGGVRRAAAHQHQRALDAGLGLELAQAAVAQPGQLVGDLGRGGRAGAVRGEHAPQVIHARRHQRRPAADRVRGRAELLMHQRVVRRLGRAFAVDRAQRVVVERVAAALAVQGRQFQRHAVHELREARVAERGGQVARRVQRAHRAAAVAGAQHRLRDAGHRLDTGRHRRAGVVADGAQAVDRAAGLVQVQQHRALVHRAVPAHHVARHRFVMSQLALEQLLGVLLAAAGQHRAAQQLAQGRTLRRGVGRALQALEVVAAHPQRGGQLALQRQAGQFAMQGRGAQRGHCKQKHGISIGVVNGMTLMLGGSPFAMDHKASAKSSRILFSFPDSFTVLPCHS